ncbi:acetyl/propionyl-CoA carboxylase alpha subunit [Constrictibacter sp. MBR-5]|uniref:carboxyl transferase domain-containing protein n=1 Tax=Constrictibacter sp. MBR-5 TaxID=3156467 RepID=UPI00339882C8
MPIRSLLIANRGEIAIRIARAAAELDIRSVAVFSEDDATSLHVRKADEARPLPGTGVAAYLDAARIIGVAREAGCDAIHPGYGFLAENAGFARACAEAGIIFVGPDPDALDLFGDKTSARTLAQRCGVPVLEGTAGVSTLEQVKAFFASLGPNGAVMLKAAAGGGGRGMRPVRRAEDLPEAYERCASEARAAFGNGDLYAERLFPKARHIEVQILGDGTGDVCHLWERECSVQRQRQKIVEIAPAPNLSPSVRERILGAALNLAEAVRYRNAGTVEFLLDASREGEDAPFAFIETNARLQVEHTVTEEVTGLDIVRLQLEIAGGGTLAALGLGRDRVPAPRGTAIQLRVNLETMGEGGMAKPAGGTLTAYEPPAGPGVRVDGYGYPGYRTNPRFDSLLAKVIVHAAGDGAHGGLERAAAKAYRALSEFRIAGAPTNAPFLQNVLRDPDFLAGRVHTGFIEERPALIGTDPAAHQRLYFEPAAATRRVGARVDAADPLAVLAYGKDGGADVVAEAMPSAYDTASPSDVTGPENTVPLPAPMQGTIVSVTVGEGAAVRQGEQVLVMEAMKMEHVIAAQVSGIVRRITVERGDTVLEDHPLAFIEEADVGAGEAAADEEIDLDAIRPDLAEVLARKAKTLDPARPDAVARRRKTGQRTVRENVDDLVDPDSFIEYGALTLAARRQRMAMQDLIDRTPADGLVCGIGRVNGDRFPDEAARTMVVAYDYTVLAGTQGKKNHQKKDRMFELAHEWRLPLVLFAEGGGGRPGDTDVMFGANLQTEAFQRFGKLSGLVPLVGITSGRCFAGNAVLLGCCDVIIATANSTIGMGGPAMIEGGGLGVFKPEEVGPMSVQVPNGVVDIAVADEEEAVAVAKKYLSYFQGPVADWDCADQRLLRRAIPENRLRVYDVRRVIDTLADAGSVLEVRRGFGHGIVTAFIRVEGRPLGVIANNPMHLGGAIDSDASDKAARFMQLCDAFDIPILSLCDTPGNMVGPEYERTGLVRHCCRMFVIAANITVPVFTVVLRKGYGLGAQGMAGGGFHAPFMTISWPTGEFGGMGLEGAVKLGYRDELAKIEDPAERKAAYDRRVAGMYEQGKALSIASFFELDDVIDPADTRRWIMSGLRSLPPIPPRAGKKRPNIDTW